MKNVIFIVLLGASVANASQAAPHRQTDTPRTRVAPGILASVGGPALGSGTKGSGVRFPVLPAGAPMRQLGFPQSKQANQVSNKAVANNPAGATGAAASIASATSIAPSGSLQRQQTTSGNRARGNGAPTRSNRTPGMTPRVRDGAASSGGAGQRADQHPTKQSNQVFQQNQRKKASKQTAGAARAKTNGGANTAKP